MRQYQARGTLPEGRGGVLALFWTSAGESTQFYHPQRTSSHTRAGADPTRKRCPEPPALNPHPSKRLHHKFMQTLSIHLLSNEGFP